MTTHYIVSVRVTEYVNEPAKTDSRYQETPAVNREMKLCDSQFAGEKLDTLIYKATEVLGMSRMAEEQ
jgi:hypothetical protein